MMKIEEILAAGFMDRSLYDSFAWQMQRKNAAAVAFSFPLKPYYLTETVEAIKVYEENQKLQLHRILYRVLGDSTAKKYYVVLWVKERKITTYRYVELEGEYHLPETIDPDTGSWVASFEDMLISPYSRNW